MRTLNGISRREIVNKINQRNYFNEGDDKLIYFFTDTTRLNYDELK